MTNARVLTTHWSHPESHTLAHYRAHGGYASLEKTFSMERTAIIAEIKAANVRGRGGAGFPAGVKMGFVPVDGDKPRYVVVNSDEAEPGTFKDRYILLKDPHRMLEGAAIAARAIDAHTVYVFVRGEFHKEARLLQRAIDEAYEAGVFGRKVLGHDWALDVYIHRGAGAYICGEETALLEALEGRRGYPRLKPPFPAVAGAFAGPTLINNVETVSNFPWILEHGGPAFTALGVPNDGGTRLVGVSGCVERPGVYELPSGIKLSEIIFQHAGGVRDGRKLKAVVPGGTSMPALAPHELDVPMTVDGIRAAGSMIGTAAVVVFDELSCMVRALWRIEKFFHHESCGQCTPCREGTGWLERILAKLEQGAGVPADVDLLDSVARNIGGNTICALGDAAQMPMNNAIKKWRDEFLRHAVEKRCPFPAYPVRPSPWTPNAQWLIPEG